MDGKKRFIVVALLVLAMMFVVAAPAFATVNPGQHNGWVEETPMHRPRGLALGWIVDDNHNPQGQHNGWVLCQ